MRNLISLGLLILSSVQLFAQVQFNPQIGMNFMTFTNPPAGTNYSGKVGGMIGADFRFGERFQIQPGVHYIGSATAYETNDGIVVSDQVVHKYIKLKGLAAFNIVDAEEFKFRVNFGPAYDFLLSAKTKDADNDIKDDFKNGTFYLQGGLGVDFLFLTADVGYAQGLSQTFAGEGAPDSKTAGLYFTVGIIFGKGK